jgi:hypothetical protein
VTFDNIVTVVEFVVVAELPLGEVGSDLLQQVKNNIGTSVSTQEAEVLSDSRPGSGNPIA